jgi:hypothetical protein
MVKYRVTFFSLFLSLVLWLIVGGYHYSALSSGLYFITFFFVVIFSYRIYLLIEKLGVFLYEKHFKKIIENVKRTKEEIQK